MYIVFVLAFNINHIRTQFKEYGLKHKIKPNMKNIFMQTIFYFQIVGPPEMKPYVNSWNLLYYTENRNLQVFYKGL